MLVDRKYQLKEMLVPAIANVLAVLLTSLLLSWFFLLVWDDSLVVRYEVKIPLYIGGIALLVLGCSVWVSMWRSRSVAGMISKLSLVLDDMARGKIVDEVRFRKSDPFQELAGPLNRCLEKMTEVRERRKKEGQIHGLVKGLLKQIEGEENSRCQLRDQIEEILEMQKQLR